jgi:putative phosphotransacetylase
MSNELLVPVGVSNRHVHLTQEDLEKLFGEGYKLTNIKDLTQKGEFAAKEVVTIVGFKGAIEKVRILGPVRSKTQIEISQTDSFKLGIKAPVKQSGKTEGTPGCIIIGPKGIVTLEEGVIIADHHIHMSPDDAEKHGYEDGDRVSVEAVSGVRSLIFKNVLVRVKPTFVLDFHIDTDEANAALLKTGDKVRIIEKNS